MMKYEVLVTGNETVDFSPANEALEVSQNIRTIITTPKYSVPMFREFGAGNNILDETMTNARAKISSDIIMAVKKYEPRAKLTDINFSADDSGKLSVRLRFILKEAAS